MNLPSRPARAALFAAFFLSGACGLAYEVVWTRLISREVGHTSHALATVLAAFMGGLALGSWIGSRIVARLKNPVAGYGVLEVAIGLSALAVPSLIAACHPAMGALYRSEALSGVPYHAARFAICALVLLVPTTCMGATLPLLSEPLVRRREELGGTLGWLYATNTLGAVAGALSAGFVLLPSFGMSATVRAAAIANAAIGVGALLVSRRNEVAPAATEVAGPVPRGRPIYLWGMLLSGALAMANQVVWTRYLSLQVGTSVYAFTIIVSSFILGMAAGSLFFGRRADRVRDPVAAFGKLQVAIGFSCLLLYWLFALLAESMPDLVRHFQGSFFRMQAAFFAAVFSVVFLPTFFLGGTFPTAARGYVPEGARTGPAVGRLYAWNTVGAILGSAAGGFLVVPSLGVWRAILWLGLANVLLGAVVFLRSASTVRALGALASLVVAGTCVLWTPLFGDHLLLHGSYVHAVYDAVAKKDPARPSPLAVRLPLRSRVCWHKDGASASVSVMADDTDLRSLRIDGRTQASNGDDMQTQVLVAQLPLLLHPGPVKEVMTVGLGSGVTAGSATVHPGVHVDCVEISGEVVEAARRYFARENLGVCASPKATVTVEDARSHIAFTGKRYDVIISEPSHIFISGMADLFTVEYYEACRARLAEGGTISQWVQAYWHDPEDVRTIVATFLSVFPNAWMFESIPDGDYVLVAGRGDLDFGAIVPRVTGPVAKELARIGYERPEQLLTGLVAGPDALRAWVEGARLHRDDTVHIEFSSPRRLYEGVKELSPHLASMRAGVRPSPAWPAGADRCREARRTLVEVWEARGLSSWQRIERVTPILGVDPCASSYMRGLWYAALETGGEGADAAVRMFPDDVDLAVRAGEIAYDEGRVDRAEALLREAKARFPRAARPGFELAKLLLAQGRSDDSNREWQDAWGRWEAVKRGAGE